MRKSLISCFQVKLRSSTIIMRLILIAITHVECLNLHPKFCFEINRIGMKGNQHERKEFTFTSLSQLMISSWRFTTLEQKNLMKQYPYLTTLQDEKIKLKSKNATLTLKLHASHWKTWIITTKSKKSKTIICLLDFKTGKFIITSWMKD